LTWVEASHFRRQKTSKRFLTCNWGYFVTKGWDVFRILPPQQSLDRQYIGLFARILKP